MNSQINTNLVFLADRITNLTAVLGYLRQNNIISENEREEIEIKGTTMERNVKLLNVIQRKEMPLKMFLEILRRTSNGHCADVIEGKQNQREHLLLKPKILKNKWWPVDKILMKCLHKRKIGDKLLIDELHERLLRDENRMVVICESVGASKLTGMGGVGKTITATWYAHHFEKEYDHVLWIDSGEDSLLKSFKKLARNLKIKDRNEFIDLEDYLIKSYEYLEEFKCLWIFDNAENCRGDNGIQKILPVRKNNFYCLITSRLRDWGIPNVGYGQISRFELNIFWEKESLEFLKENLDKEIQQTDRELKQLFLLLGNLPLAMQIAVAALNVKKIDVRGYIEKASTQDFENNSFDDYEKTINSSVNITLELIGKEKGGRFVKEILDVFGYIRPDNVEKRFLTTVFNCDSELTNLEMTKALELLAKYSLITEVNTTQEAESNDKQIMTCFSIHRLLQQVIRHNGRNTEKDTLRKILCCKRFFDYKLLPFTKYAEEEIRKEFPTIKAALLNQKQLKILLKEKRIEEAVELAKFVDKEIKASTTKFNYALCLEMNGQLQDQITILEELYRQDMKEEEYYDYDVVEIGMLKLEREVSKSLVGGHLLVSHCKMDNKDRMQEILQDRKSFKMIISQEMMTALLTILNSHLIHSNYSLASEGSMFTLVLGGDTKRNLENVHLKDGNGKDANMTEISSWLPKKLNTLHIDFRKESQIFLSLKSIFSIANITLYNSLLNLDSVNRISPKELTLRRVSFVKNGQELKNVFVNEFIDFHKMKRLELTCFDKKNLSIDLSEEESANMEYLFFCGVTVVSLKSTNGRVSIKEAKIDNSLDLSILPTSLEKLTLSFGTEVSVSGGIDLPNLKYLDLWNWSYSPHIRSLQLTHLNLHLHLVEKLNVDFLPPSIKTIRIDNRIDRLRNELRLFGGVIHLDKLILYGFPLDEVEEMLPYFLPRHLVLSGYTSPYKPDDLTTLMDKQIRTIALGEVVWKEQDFKNSLFSKYVDKESEYYLFHNVAGKAIEERDFDNYKK